MGKKSQFLGKVGEEVANVFLNSIGARCVEKISTPIINIGGKVIYHKKSSIDFTAALPSPQGCVYQYSASRIEVKLCDDDNLVHSRLSKNQIRWLIEWDNCGLSSFVLWVHRRYCIMFKYPSEYFKKGKSISVGKAIEIAFKTNIKR